MCVRVLPVIIHSLQSTALVLCRRSAFEKISLILASFCQNHKVSNFQTVIYVVRSAVHGKLAAGKSAQRLTFYCVELLQNLFRNIVHPAVVSSDKIGSTSAGSGA